MKKIIALAVASAFVAPVMAADVTISGDIDYNMTNASGANTFKTTQQDLIVTASETLANGIAVTGYISLEGADGTEDALDTMVTLTGAFGEISVGDDADAGYNAFDNKTDVASADGDSEISSGATTKGAVQFKPNLGIEGLSAAIGYAANSSEVASGEETGYGIQYSVNGFVVAYYAADVDGETDNASGISASYTMGPAYIAVDNYSDMGGVSGTDALTIAGTYKLGNVTAFFEQTKNEEASKVDAKETTYGFEYDMGSIDLYVVSNSAETAGASAITSTADKTILGLEYKF